MKIFDCFMFYDEELLLDVRLNILDEYVDFFNIVESEYFHKGKKRQLKFNIVNLKNLRIKLIIYIVQKNEPKWKYESCMKKTIDKTRSYKIIINAYLRENDQRNHISNGLINANR